MLNTLIVEDNSSYRQSLRQLLAERFPAMQIAEAEDGEEALRQALSMHFDLIFTDIRLPRGNGLDLTRAIKTVLVDSVICVITSHDILEYREAAFHNGADHFMVKGESTEAEIVGLVESWLRTRFIALIMVSDASCREQLNRLLSIHWPAMVVTEAISAASGLDHVTTLKPDMVLLELGLSGSGVYDLIRDIRAQCPDVTLIGMTDAGSPAWQATANGHGVDYCVSLTPIDHPELVAIVNALQAEQTRH
jgi:DNA-binding NarL/FixJ family response regulator